MKKTLVATMLFVFAGLTVPASLQARSRADGYPINPIPFTSVRLASGTFWGQRLEASRNTTIPLAFSKCEESGRYQNFIKAARPSESYKVDGFSFDDTDVYKVIEGASYLLQTNSDTKMVQYIDSVLNIVAKAQEPDGYLYTARTMNPKHPHAWSGSKRWEKVEDLSHEFYNLGHLIEGAIAHYQATNDKKFLNIAIRYADCVVREIGAEPGQKCVVPGHQIAEMALAKLYTVTGEKKYLDLAKFFLDMRGKTSRRDQYSQAHKPVVEQDEAVGHAVRAGYMYTGMADVAALTGDSTYIKAIDKIWDNIVRKKYYITGGVGATAHGEAFGKNYELPNMSAYCETCAAIAQVYLNYRLFLLHGHSKYYDCLERTLYNGVISGVSIDGGAFFYPNPLQSMGQHQRQPWFGCACCPSNVARFIPSVPGYVYAVKDNTLFVNLFMGNTSELKLKSGKVTLAQHTNYPWDGKVTVEVKKTIASAFEMKIRIPGWVRNQVVPSDLYRYTDKLNLNYTIKVNNEIQTAMLQDGYFTLRRKWKKGDKVQIHFEMQPRTVRANNNVVEDRGRIAVERGPLVYCAEWVDNDFDVLRTLMNQAPKFKVEQDTTLLNGINKIKTRVQTLSFGKDGALQAQSTELTLIPYYAWAHRGSGNMTVWLAQDVSAIMPAKAPTLASESTVKASVESPAINAINDGLVPTDGEDRSIPYIHWWPKKNAAEWLVYEFKTPQKVQNCVLYWFDDAPWGGCRVPQSWRILYKDSQGNWQPVNHAGVYRTEKGSANSIDFDPVTTSALKLELQLPTDNSSGVFEWEVR